MEHRRGAYRFLVGKPEGKRSLEIPRRRWENIIKMEASRSRIERHDLY
jgi:hypothetical protein